jgi:uncharacterized protein YjdB
MSSAFMEEPSTEYDDAYDDAEPYDSEAYDDSESAASRARRRRARELAAARRRAGARRARALPATAPPRAVVSAVKELDLQAQVQQDTLRSTIATQNKKLDRTNLATVATLLIGEAFRTFGTPENDFLRAGIQAAPLLVLAPGTSRGGVEGVIRHPAFYGGAGVLGLAFIGEQRNRNSSVHTVNVLGPAQLTVKKEDVFLADVLDGRGRPSNVTPTWQSDNIAIADINATTGRVTAGANPGVAIITVTAGDVKHRFRLEVVAAPAAAK